MDPFPIYSTTKQQHELPCLDEHLRLRPLLHNRHTETKKYGPNERKIKTLKIELSDEEIANLSDADFRTLVIRMLTEMAEYGRKTEEKVKAM